MREYQTDQGSQCRASNAQKAVLVVGWIDPDDRWAPCGGIVHGQ